MCTVSALLSVLPNHAVSVPSQTATWACLRADFGMVVVSQKLCVSGLKAHMQQISMLSVAQAQAGESPTSPLPQPIQPVS
jgi:hypothetical protein